MRSSDQLLELIEYEQWRQAKLDAEISKYQCRILRLGEQLHCNPSISSLTSSSQVKSITPICIVLGLDLFSVLSIYLHGRRSHRSWGTWPPLWEAKGTGGHNLGIIHISHYLTAADIRCIHCTHTRSHSYLTYCSYHVFILMSTPCRLYPGVWTVVHYAVNCFATGGL